MDSVGLANAGALAVLAWVVQRTVNALLTVVDRNTQVLGRNSEVLRDVEDQLAALRKRGA